MEATQKSRAGWWALLLLVGLLLAVWIAKPQLVNSLAAIIQYRLKLDYPQNNNKELHFKGLSAPVKIHFDAYGIPHFEAKNDRDLLIAVGYIHSRDRFFQMDMFRRISRGRLSELIGEQKFLGATTVGFDRAMRGWGMERKARSSWATVNSTERALLTAYCQGVNTALKHFKHPEYRILGVKPVPFKPIDIFAIGLLNSWSISHNWQQELVRLLLALQLGVDASSTIYPHTPLRNGISIPLPNASKKLPPAVVPALRKMFAKSFKASKTKHPKRTVPQPRKHATRKLIERLQVAAASILWAGNSNAWVVKGHRSKSGHPLLASDPHLSHFVPSMLMQQHLKTPTLDVIGATMPGVPYVLMGHNRHLAWGITSAVADAMDLVIERPDPNNKNRVLREGKECPLQVQKVEIRIRKGKQLQTRTFPVRRTCHGPLLNDMYPHLLPKGSPWVAVQWRIEGVNLEMWSRANRAKTVKELYSILKTLTTPVSTVQAADTQGNIGIFWAGTIPKRQHLGTFPYPGWKKEYQWGKNIDPKHIPFGFNSKKGYFAHGNNLLVDPSKSKHVLQIDSAPPYRVNRIRELILKTPKHTFKTFSDIQKDVKVLRAALVLPYILSDLKDFRPTQVTAQLAKSYLFAWKNDLQATPQSIGTALFFATYCNAVRAAMEEKLTPQALKFFLSQRYTTNITDGWFTKNDHIAWDHPKTKKRETRTEIVRKAFMLAVNQLRAKQGDDVKSWKWGKLHNLQLQHPFGKIPVVGEFFNLPRFDGMGAMETVWKSHFNMGHPKTPFRTVGGPVYRMIVDLGNIHKSRWIIDTGASGWAGSPHYGDQFQKWVRGQTIPMLSHWPSVISSSHGTWTLTPKK